jgi:two-component system, NarL family, response regulator LiaR
VVANQKIRVLVVNDQRPVNDLWQQLINLTDDMECVGNGANGEEAIMLARELVPDVIIMDVLMPGMDGNTATRIIKSELPNTQVVVYSAYNGMEQKAYEAGAVEYLLMPISPEKLRQTIRKVYADFHKK